MKDGLIFFAMLFCMCAVSAAATHGLPPSCSQPNLIRDSSIAPDSTVLQWQGDAAYYDDVFMYDTAAFTPSASGVYTTDTAVSLVGLTSNTDYYFRVQAHCGRDASSWSQKLKLLYDKMWII